MTSKFVNPKAAPYVVGDVLRFEYRVTNLTDVGRQLSSRWATTDVTRAVAGPQAVSVGAGWRVLRGFLNDPDRWAVPAPDALEYYSVADTPETVVL